MDSEVYLGIVNDNITMTRSMRSALDIKLISSESSPLLSAMSVGRMAIGNSKKGLILKTPKKNDEMILFKFVLTPLGTFIIQQDDKCLGMRSNDLKQSIVGVDCSDESSILRFVRSDATTRNLDGILLNSFEGKIINEGELKMKLSPVAADTGFVGGVPQHAF